MNEKDLQSLIRIALSDSCVCFRINVGLYYTKEGGRISTGVPNGFSDLFGHRKLDGKAFYIECKTPTGKVRPEQKNFIKQMKQSGALAGIARSVEEALEIVSESNIKQEEL